MTMTFAARSDAEHGQCAITVSTRIIRMILSRTQLPYIQIQHGKRLQVVPDFDALPFCQRNQSAAFILSHQLLVVWEDDPMRLIDRAQGLQDALVNMIWGNTLAYVTDNTTEKNMGIDADTLSIKEEDDNVNPRRVIVFQSAYTSIAICMLTVAIGSGWRQVAVQQVQEPNWLRLLFLIPIPGQVWLSLVRTQ